MDKDKPQAPDATGNWQFKSEDQGSGSSAQATDAAESSNMQQPAAPDEEVDWTASEFIAHEKGVNWYLAMIASVFFFTAVVYLVTKDKITAGIIILAAIIFGVYAKRQPRTLKYHLEYGGLTIDEKFYDFGQFRSFVVAHEGALSSVSFMPLKRFMPVLTVYYAPDDEKKIVQLLSARLPMEDLGKDVIDRFLHRIRF
jgi:hypothetical protein